MAERPAARAQGYNSLQKTGGRMPAGGGAAFPSAASARLRALVGPSHPEAQSLRGEPAGADSFEALAFKARAAPHEFCPVSAVKAHTIACKRSCDRRRSHRWCCMSRVRVTGVY